MKKNITEERLGVLLDATILRYCETMNLVDITSVCDAMFSHLLEGDLDREFISPKLADAKKEEKAKAFSIARKYAYLCFYEGKENYWLESVDGYNSTFLDELIAEKVLDNYNFLVELAYEKGENAVKELINVGQNDIIKSSIVDYARNTFMNDKILKSVLSNDSYNDLSPKRKAVLYEYSEGVLYDKYNVEDTEDFVLIPEEQLLLKIAEYTADDKISKMKNLTEIIDYLGDEVFKSVIRDIHLEALNDKEKEKYR